MIERARVRPRWAWWKAAALSSGLLLAARAVRATDPPGAAPAPAPSASSASFLLTSTFDFPASGEARAALGVSFFDGVTRSFSGLSGDLLQVGTLRTDLGLGEFAEFQFRWVVWNRLSIDRSRSTAAPGLFPDSSTSDVGDSRFATLVRVFRETPSRPAIGFRVEAKAPHSDERKGIDTNTTDVAGSLLFEKRLGPARLSANVGLAILTDAVRSTSQNDVITYGLSAVWRVSPRLDVLGELNGRVSTSTPGPGTEDHAVVRAGVSAAVGPFRVGLLGSTGLESDDERWGVHVAVAHSLKLF